MDRLTLEVTRYTGPHQWYWALSDAGGVVLEDYEAALDPADWQYAAFARLSRYLRLNVDQGRPLSSEAEIIGEVGRWAGHNALGPIAATLADRAPAVVAVVFPAPAAELMFRPWELAVAGDAPLACQDVSLVMIPPAALPPRPKSPVSSRLRMLAAFSLPAGAPSLVLQEQRRALVRQAGRIRARHGKAIDVTALQYDVSRDRLRDLLEAGAGWDVVHFSGHGLVDGLVLEGPGGGPDTVPVADLISLLRPAREQLKLLVLSSCNSAAAPPAEVLDARFGQLPEPGGAAAGGPAAERVLPGLAEHAARELDCAVLAMRYPVDDDFSIAFAAELYEQLLGHDQPLARAMQLALPKALGSRPRPGVPPLSVGTPALFGQRCLDLSLAPPPAPLFAADPAQLTMARFPGEPPHLVGRSAAMSAASRVLSGDDQTGIMFTGPAGIGKSTCAVELAYRHEHDFPAKVFYPGPLHDAPIGGSLTAFAQAFDQQLPALNLAQHTASASRLAGFLPMLTELMEREAILVVIDGIDGLLSADSYWRDPSWEKLINALLGHSGYSRLILTGRHPPKAIPGGLALAPLTPLTAQESVLLARQLPGLGSLIRGSSGIPITAARQILAEALTAAAGNPAAIHDRDQQLASVDLNQVIPRGEPSAEYAELISRWTCELT